MIERERKREEKERERGREKKESPCVSPLGRRGGGRIHSWNGFSYLTFPVIKQTHSKQLANILGVLSEQKINGTKPEGHGHF